MPSSQRAGSIFSHSCDADAGGENLGERRRPYRATDLRIESVGKGVVGPGSAAAPWPLVTRCVALWLLQSVGSSLQAGTTI